VAALVFSTSTLGDSLWLRQTVMLAVTAAAFAAALGLRRGRMTTTSAVAVAGLAAALALVCVGLFAPSFDRDLYPSGGPFYFAGAAAAILAAALGAAGYRLRVRPWVTAMAFLLPAVPILASAGAMRALGPQAPGSNLALNLGLLAAAGAAAARHLIGRAWRGPLRFEEVSLGIVGGIALGYAALLAMASGWDGLPPRWGQALLLLGCAAAAFAHARFRSNAWSWCAGALAVGAAAWAVPPDGRDNGVMLPLASVAALAAWAVLAGTAWLPHGRRGRAGPERSGRNEAAPLAGGRNGGGRDGGGSARGRLAYAGGWVVALGAALPVLILELGRAADVILRVVRDGQDSGLAATAWTADVGVWAAALRAVVLAGVAGALALAAILPRTGVGPPAAMVRLGRALAPWAAWALAASLTAFPGMPGWASFVLLPALAGACWVAAHRIRWGGVRSKRWFVALPALRVGGLVLLLAAAAVSWGSRPAALGVGAAAVGLTLFAARRLVLPATQPIAIGFAYAYALAIIGTGLWWYPLGWDGQQWPPVAGLLAVLGAVVAIAATGARRLPRPAWGMVIGLSAITWTMTVLAVVAERTWWSAAACAAVLAAELTLAAPRPIGTGWQIPGPIRFLASASILPTACVILVCAGAQILPGSGSPVLLPAAAVLAGLAASGAQPWSQRMAGGRTEAGAADGPAAAAGVRLARLAVEGSALATAVGAVFLALVLSATGASTVLAVCAIVGVGASVLAVRPDRRRVWWLAALAFSGVLWSALNLWDIGLVEAYTAPPAVVALLTAVLLARRDPAWAGLFSGGLALAFGPSLVLLAVGADALVRAEALTFLAAALLAVALELPRSALTRPMVWGAMAAGLAPGLLAVHFLGQLGQGGWFQDAYLRLAPASVGAGLTGQLPWDLVQGLSGNANAVFAIGVGLTCLAAAMLAAGGNRALPAGRRGAGWRYAPAIAVAALGPVMGVRFTWPIVAAMWLAAVAFTSLAARSAWTRCQGRPTLPPVAFLWPVALAVGIAGWSLRELRVEAFSLPLGLGLLACGVIAQRFAATARAARRSWPAGYAGGNSVLVPGVLAVLGPSTLAIGTDPMTWRAILVVVLALGFMLLGAQRLWSACLWIGVGDLAVAIALVFAARRTAVSAMPWLLTLTAAGGLLLALAIQKERRREPGARPIDPGGPPPNASARPSEPPSGGLNRPPEVPPGGLGRPPEVPSEPPPGGLDRPPEPPSEPPSELPSGGLGRPSEVPSEPPAGGHARAPASGPAAVARLAR
jgi:hypothetical protein